MKSNFAKKICFGVGIAALSAASQGAEFGLFEFRTDGGFLPSSAVCDDVNCDLNFTNNPDQANAGGALRTEMSWGITDNDQSALRIINGRSFGSLRDADGADPDGRYGQSDGDAFNADPFAQFIELGTWTATGYALHYNNIVSGAEGNGTLESATVVNRLRIYGKTNANPNNNGRTLALDTGPIALPLFLNETTNQTNCAFPTPLSTNCDDIFTTAALPGGLIFEVDGNQFSASFRTVAFDNAFVINGNPFNTIFTAEDDPGVSVVQTQIQIRQVPAPGALALLGMGLAMFGFAARRKRRA